MSDTSVRVAVRLELTLLHCFAQLSFKGCYFPAECRWLLGSMMTIESTCPQMV